MSDQPNADPNNPDEEVAELLDTAADAIYGQGANALDDGEATIAEELGKMGDAVRQAAQNLKGNDTPSK